MTTETRKRPPQVRAEEWNFNEQRARTVLDAAMRLARTDGYQWITRETVATEAGVSAGTVSNAYGTMLDLKRAVMTEAVARGDLVIIAQGLADGSSIARNAPEAVKQRALAALV